DGEDIVIGRFENGTLQEVARVEQGIRLGELLIVADVDSDGFLDVVSKDQNDLRVSRGEAGLAFSPPTSQSYTNNEFTSDTQRIAFGALSARGVVDAISGTNTTFNLFENDGTGRFVDPRAVDATVPRAFSLHDFNGDGALDLITSGAVPGSGDPGAALFLQDTDLGPPNGEFVRSGIASPQGTEAVATPNAADLNSDGVLDALLLQLNEFFNPGESSRVVLELGRRHGRLPPVSLPIEANSAERPDGIAFGGWLEPDAIDRFGDTRAAFLYRIAYSRSDVFHPQPLIENRARGFVLEARRAGVSALLNNQAVPVAAPTTYSGALYGRR
ncbi:MAG: VCBS repeat-containing protein, partial [Myxococcota bacterium]